MREIRSFCVVIATTVILAACGGHAGTAPVPPAVSADKSRGTLSVVIKVPSATRAAHSKRPNYVSPSTQSITIAIDSGAAVAYGLTPASPGCIAATSTAPLTCTITLSINVGPHTATFTTYDGANGSGNVLSSNSNVSLMVNSGVANAFGLTLNGAVANIVLSLETSNPPQGTSATVPLALNAYDADGNLIVGPGIYENGPIVLTDNDSSGHTVLSGTTAVDPSSVITLSYDGAPMNAATITATAGTVSTTTTFVAQPARMTLYVANSGSNSVLEFPLNANGNVSPEQQIGGSNTQLNAPSGVAVSNAGDIIVANGSANSVSVFAGGTTGNVAPKAVISGSNTGLSNPQQVATDIFGNIYVANETANTIAVYSAGASGNVVPIRTLAGQYISKPSGVAVDATGNVYVASINFDGNGIVTVYAPNAGGTSLSPLEVCNFLNAYADAVYPYSVSVDQAGNIYSAGSNYAGTWGLTIFNRSCRETGLIYGASTGLGWYTYITVDGSGNVYTSNSSTNVVGIFTAGSTGNIPPAYSISGAATQLSTPAALGI